MTRDEIREKIEGLGIYFDPDHPDHISRERRRGDTHRRRQAVRTGPHGSL